MNRLFTVLAIALVPALSFAQTDLDSLQVTRLATIMHWGASGIYGADDATYEVHQDWTAPWDEIPTITTTEADRIAQHLLDRAVLRYERDNMFNKMKMRLLTNLPEGIEGGPGVTKISATGSDLRDSLGTIITANGSATNHMFSFDDGRDPAGMGHNASTHKITMDATLVPKPVSPVTGNITYSAKARTGIAKVAISPKDVGKTIILGDLTGTIVTYDDERIVIAHDSGNGGGLVQYNAAGEPLKRKAKNMSRSNLNMPEFLFTAFEANPEITKKELQELAFDNLDKFKELKENPKMISVFRRYPGSVRAVLYRTVMSEPVEKTIAVRE